MIFTETYNYNTGEYGIELALSSVVSYWADGKLMNSNLQIIVVSY